MKIKTKFFGDVEIKKEDIILFKRPILGFDDDNEFILIDIKELDSLKCLQSISNSSLCFIVSTPWIYFENYAFDIEEQVKEELKITSQEDVEIYNILTLKENFDSSTINLSAPIVLNNVKNLASQIIINDDSLKTSHPIKS